MKKYHVILLLILGSYEKSAHHLVRAFDRAGAGKQAIEDECHCEPEWEGDDFDECWDCGEFVYRVHEVHELTDAEYHVFKEYWT